MGQTSTRRSSKRPLLGLEFDLFLLGNVVRLHDIQWKIIRTNKKKSVTIKCPHKIDIAAYRQ